MPKNRYSRLDINTLSIKWCFLIYLIYRQALKDKSRKIMAKQLDTFVIVYIDNILNYVEALSQAYKKILGS